MRIDAVAARLAKLRELVTPLGAREARARMEPAAPAEPFDVAVARRLAELRALLELTKYLHGARPRLH